jgi:hypothetical protein
MAVELVEVQTPPEIPLTACEMVRQEIAKYSGWDIDIMTAIAISENRPCDPLNHNLSMNENHGICIGSYGVLQVGCLHYHDHENRDDLSTNVAVAYRVWLKRGYQAWTMYKNGEYKKWL